MPNISTWLIRTDQETGENLCVDTFWPDARYTKWNARPAPKWHRLITGKKKRMKIGKSEVLSVCFWVYFHRGPWAGVKMRSHRGKNQRMFHTTEQLTQQRRAREKPLESFSFFGSRAPPGGIYLGKWEDPLEPKTRAPPKRHDGRRREPKKSLK